MASLPTKLKQDTIAEALFEIRFEHGSLPEIAVGKLAGTAAWAGMAQSRLPLGDLPQQIRDMQPDMRYQAILQLSSDDGLIIKIGPRVISAHVLAPYPGWPAFGPKLGEMVRALFDACPGPNIQRLGLRYINAVQRAHGLSSLWDLNINFEVTGARPSGELAASYRTALPSGNIAQVGLATREFINGGVPEDTVGAVDIDIWTASAPGTISIENVLEWLEAAHAAEKETFFALWPTAVIEKLRED